LSWLAAILIIVGVSWPQGARAQQKPAAPKPPNRFTAAVNLVLEQGVDAILPPHLSVLLGVSPTEKECQVKQRTVQTENLVRGFDVATDHHNNIVLFLERPGERMFYLVSPRGTLRKVVTVKEGVGQEQKIGPKLTKSFQEEKQIWLEVLVPENPWKKASQ
jgi:hypothetical protein